jgi:hypothetical protein
MISVTTSVTTTRVKIVSAAVNSTRTVIVRPVGNDVYVGGSDVTTANGLQISKDTNFSIVVPPGDELWAVVPTGTHSVTTLTSYAALL